MQSLFDDDVDQSAVISQPAQQPAPVETTTEVRPTPVQPPSGALTGTHKTILGVALCGMVLGSQWMGKADTRRLAAADAALAETAKIASKQHPKCYALIQTQPCLIEQAPQPITGTSPAFAPAMPPPSQPEIQEARQHLGDWMQAGADFQRIHSYVAWLEINQDPPGYPKAHAVRYVLALEGIY